MTDSLSLFGIKKAAVMDVGYYKRISLPIVARNCLENGKSSNLWYEEVVPHETVMYFYIISDDSDAELLNLLTEAICSEPIQLGGGASIGYGLCSVNELV